MDHLKKLFEIERRINREDLLYKTSDTKIMPSLGRDMKDTILNNAQEEQIRLKSAMDKLSSTT